MKTSPNLFRSTLLLVFLFLCGCGKEFGPQRKKAESHYANKNYIEVIDTINLALPYWKKSDGTASKAIAYQIQGLSYHKLNKFKKAIECYNQAIALSENTVESARNSGDLYLISGKPTLAIEAYKKALKMKKNDPLSLLGMGNAYYEIANYLQAKKIYQRLVDTSPGVREAMKYKKLADKEIRKKRSKKKKRSRK